MKKYAWFVVIILIPIKSNSQPAGFIYVEPFSIYRYLFIPENQDKYKKNQVRFIREYDGKNTWCYYYNKQGKVDSVIWYYHFKRKNHREKIIQIHYDSAGNGLRYHYSLKGMLDEDYLVEYKDTNKFVLRAIKGLAISPKSPLTFDTIYYRIQFLENGNYSESKDSLKLNYFDKYGNYINSIDNGVLMDSISISTHGDTLIESCYFFDFHSSEYINEEMRIYIKNIIQKVKVFHVPSGLKPVTIDYSYDFYGNLVFKHSYSGLGFFDDEVETFIYNDKGLMIRWIRISGDVVRKSTSFLYEYYDE